MPKLLDSPGLGRADPIVLFGITLMLPYLVAQHLGRAVDLGGNGLDCRPQRAELGMHLEHGAYGTLAELRGELRWLLHHGSLFAKIESSSNPVRFKPRAVQLDCLHKNT